MPAVYGLQRSHLLGLSRVFNPETRQKFKENLYLDIKAFQELKAWFSTARCQHCVAGLEIPRDFDTLDILGFTNLNRDDMLYKIRCTLCENYTGACLRPVWIDPNSCSEYYYELPVGRIDICRETKPGSPVDVDIARLFSIWCVLVRFDQLCVLKLDTERTEKPDRIEWDLLVTGSTSRRLREILSRLLILQANRRKEYDPEKEISLFRTGPLFTYLDNILESASVSKMEAWETCYDYIFMFLKTLLGNEILKRLVFAPRLPCSFAAFLIAPGKIYDLPGDISVNIAEDLSHRMVTNITRLYREGIFFEKHLNYHHVSEHGIKLVAELYTQMNDLQEQELDGYEIPFTDLPWGTQCSWTDDILTGHKFSKEFNRLGRRSDKSAKAVMNNIKFFGSRLPEGIFLKASTSCIGALQALIFGRQGTAYAGGLFLFDILLDGDFPSSRPRVLFAQEDSMDLITWLRINPHLSPISADAPDIEPSSNDGEDAMSGDSDHILYETLVALQRDMVGDPSPLRTHWPSLGRDDNPTEEMELQHLYFTQLKTFIHGILFWLTCEKNQWTDITDLYWRCSGLQVLDMVSEWFLKNPLLQLLQAASIEEQIGEHQIESSESSGWLFALYGHIESKFWRDVFRKLLKPPTDAPSGNLSSSTHPTSSSSPRKESSLLSEGSIPSDSSDPDKDTIEKNFSNSSVASEAPQRGRASITRSRHKYLIDDNRTSCALKYVHYLINSKFWRESKEEEKRRKGENGIPVDGAVEVDQETRIIFGKHWYKIPKPVLLLQFDWQEDNFLSYLPLKLEKLPRESREFIEFMTDAMRTRWDVVIDSYSYGNKGRNSPGNGGYGDDETEEVRGDDTGEDSGDETEEDTAAVSYSYSYWNENRKSPRSGGYKDDGRQEDGADDTGEDRADGTERSAETNGDEMEGSPEMNEDEAEGSSEMDDGKTKESSEMDDGKTEESPMMDDGKTELFEMEVEDMVDDGMVNDEMREHVEEMEWHDEMGEYDDDMEEHGDGDQMFGHEYDDDDSMFHMFEETGGHNEPEEYDDYTKEQGDDDTISDHEHEHEHGDDGMISGHEYDHFEETGGHNEPEEYDNYTEEQGDDDTISDYEHEHEDDDMMSEHELGEIEASDETAEYFSFTVFFQRHDDRTSDYDTTSDYEHEYDDDDTISDHEYYHDHDDNDTTSDHEHDEHDNENNECEASSKPVS